MTDETPAKPKRPRSDKQKANDERLRAYWKAMAASKKESSKPVPKDTQAESKAVPIENREGSKPAPKDIQTSSEPPHPSIPPKASQEKEAPSPPKKKPFRLLW